MTTFVDQGALISGSAQRPRRRMHLMGFVIAGPTWHHDGSWRHAQSDAVDALDAGRYEHIARVLERAKFDGCSSWTHWR